ncbi:MAG: tRNA dihydrouridine synthase DusB [Paracoccaceae bacterium]|nr:tRNA dihydrouridine synthase DusB [Paracoccaceae bacterium]
MAINLNNLTLDPPVFLAPMAGVTDKPSRDIAKLFSPGLVVSEMIVSSDNGKSSFEKVVRANLLGSKHGTAKCPTAVQIAGHEIQWMSYAAKVIEFEGGELIDVNMGCPAKKIVGKLAGSALMKEPTHALNMIESIVNATNLPVTLKMRLGWDTENMNAPKIAKSAENIGVQMITIHARTRNQFFKGKAIWESVKAVKDTVSIPVIVNGDIISNESGKSAIKESFADGIMVGRGAIGRPWCISELAESLYNYRPKKKSNSLLMSELVNLHFAKTLDFYGNENGLRIFRKHLAKYLKNLVISPSCRYSLVTDDSVKALERKIKFLFDNRKVNMTYDQCR